MDAPLYGVGELYEVLINQLKTENNYVSDEGVVKKWVVTEQAQSYSPELIELLLANEQLKKAFFVEAKGTKVFMLDKFLQFIEQKNYINDSYTRFSQKVGLQVSGKFLSHRNEVELVFPYKDCVLEGGQTKDDQKRNEIFFNEVLAQDEITQLLDPKVLTEAKRIDAHGEHPLDAFRRDETTNVERNLPKQTITDNLIIRGNNLLALHTLKQQFRSKVKLIYIDPPYNTGDDDFGYNDSFNHSSWLLFMKNRLEIARELLKDDGAIFIQIDHHELGYLSVLADSIFGAENRVQIIAVRTATPAGFKTVNPGPIDVTEYILFYTKNKSAFKFKKGFVPVGYNTNYNLVIENPNDKPENWTFIPIKTAVICELGFHTEKEAKQKYGSLWPSIKKELIAQYAYDHANIVVSVRDPHKPTDQVKALMAESKESGKVIVHNREKSETSYFYNGGALAFYAKKMQRIDGELCVTELLTDFWSHISWAGIAKEGGVKLKNGKKPEKLIKQIIELSTEQNEIVLDYFLGCGTTAAVAHKMGRQYIGIEQLYYGKNDATVRLTNVVKGDQTGISTAVHWQGGGDFVYVELKRFNKKFIEDIEAATTTEQLLSIWEQMKQRAFFRFSLDMQKFEENIEQFKSFSLDEQKTSLCSVLDLNQLYVNRADMNDKELKVSEEEKRITNDFYCK
ncbi:MAG: site-specific DNA-methyltransferase [Muribaculaceae bacterium]|nr:site-specific DNA-methyltransferase [Muribaculaceae bacterium]